MMTLSAFAVMEACGAGSLGTTLGWNTPNGFLGKWHTDLLFNWMSKPFAQNIVNLHRLQHHWMEFTLPIRILILFCILHGGAGVSIYSRRKDRILFIKYRLVFLGCLSRSVEIAILPSNATNVKPVKLGKQEMQWCPDAAILNLAQMTCV